MSAIKSYFREEMKTSMLTLEHPKRSDFYLSVWQTTRSVVPLLIWRVILFLYIVAIVLSSAIIYIQSGKFAFWFIYLTHWGLISILLTTAFAVAVSTRIYLYGPISAEFSLPWYVKTYWVLFNIATPMAFMITIFYWTLLYDGIWERQYTTSGTPRRRWKLRIIVLAMVIINIIAGIEEELNHGLDIAVHGLNSIIMLMLLLSNSHPSRLLHIYQPLIFGLVYMMFGLIYHFAGGTDQKGNPYIYPVVDWSTPSTTVIVVIITALLLIFLHLLTMAITAGREAIASRCINKTDVVRVEESIPLR